MSRHLHRHVCCQVFSCYRHLTQHASWWTDTSVCDEYESCCVFHSDLLIKQPHIRCFSWKAVQEEGTDLKYHGCQGVCAACMLQWHTQIDLQMITDVIRTCLGPKAMLKMILDLMGSILWAFHINFCLMWKLYWSILWTSSWACTSDITQHVFTSANGVCCVHFTTKCSTSLTYRWLPISYGHA